MICRSHKSIIYSQHRTQKKHKKLNCDILLIVTHYEFNGRKTSKKKGCGGKVKGGAKVVEKHFSSD